MCAHWLETDSLPRGLVRFSTRATSFPVLLASQENQKCSSLLIWDLGIFLYVKNLIFAPRLLLIFSTDFGCRAPSLPLSLPSSIPLPFSSLFSILHTNSSCYFNPWILFDLTGRHGIKRKFSWLSLVTWQFHDPFSFPIEAAHMGNIIKCESSCIPF